MKIANPICVALDTPDIDRAVQIVEQVKDSVGMIKVGMEFFYASGSDGYSAAAALGVPVFLDLKLHDIPNTVASGLTSLMQLNPRPAIVNIHAGAGPQTMRAAVAAMDKLETKRPKLIGLTVLTSLDDNDLAQVGYSKEMSTLEHALNQAQLVMDCGLDGVVCSARDVAKIKQACGNEFLTIVPGIRPQNSDVQDQKRIATPKSARDDGADILVIGRPITQADDPAKAAAEILASLV